MQKLLRNTSFKGKISLALICFALLPALVTGFIASSIASKNVLRIKQQEYQNQFLAYRTNINRILNDADQQILELYVDPTLISYMQMETEEAAALPFYNYMRSICNTSITESSNIEMIGIYGENGLVYTSNPAMKTFFTSCQQVAAHIETQNLTPINSWRFTRNVADEEEVHNVLINIKALRDVDTLEFYGYIVTAMDENMFSDTLKNNPSGDKLLVLDEQGSILHSTMQQELGKQISPETYLEMRDDVIRSSGSSIKIIDGERCLVSYSLIPNLGCYLVNVIRYEQLAASAEEINTITTIVVALSFTLSLLAVRTVTKSITRPLDRLFTVTKKVKNGELTARFHEEGTDEIHALGHSVNNMLDSLDRNLETIKAMMEQQRESDRQLLQAQINPHLIYNSLNSLKELAYCDDRKTLMMAIDELSKFFRTALSYGNAVIAMREELDHVLSYIAVQNICFGKHIDLQVNLSEEVQQNVIVKMTLQPIVENALLHGLAAYDMDGKITIYEELTDDAVIICVRDSGVGISETELQALNDVLQSDKDVSEAAYGLTNINSRIRYYFGYQYGLEIDSEFLCYTCVKIKLPRKGAAQHEKNTDRR